LQEEGRMTAPVIAVLDNDPSFLSLMHDLLTDAGYRTLRCRPRDVLDTHALVRRFQPMLVLLDLWLEERDDGWAFLKRLWGDAGTTHIPVVIVTGEPEILPVRADLLRAMRCRVVRKPFDLQELLDAIAAVLRSHPRASGSQPAPARGPRRCSIGGGRRMKTTTPPSPLSVRWWLPPSPHPSPFFAQRARRAQRCGRRVRWALLLC
jgi:DNA-binding response OmpR family regulator